MDLRSFTNASENMIRVYSLGLTEFHSLMVAFIREMSGNDIPVRQYPDINDCECRETGQFDDADAEIVPKRRLESGMAYS